MRLSAPAYILKQQAKALSRQENIPLYQALDRIAKREGFSAWSLLAAKAAAEKPISVLLAQWRPGDLVLLGSRPGQGKTLLSLEAAIHTMRQGHHAAFFTLYCTRAEVAGLFKMMGEGPNEVIDKFLVDDSDQICAEYIIAQLASASASTLVIIDYLQLLDQKRANPDLMHQVQQLRNFARERQLIILCLSQIDRSYDPGKRPCPGISDVRLPNPLDRGLFDRTCFLNQGKMQIASVVGQER